MEKIISKITSILGGALSTNKTVLPISSGKSGIPYRQIKFTIIKQWHWLTFDICLSILSTAFCMSSALNALPNTSVFTTPGEIDYRGFSTSL